MKIFCCKTRFRVKHQIKVCFRHGLIFCIITASGNLMNRFYPCFVKQIIQFTVIHQRGKISQQIHYISFFLLWLQQGINGLPHMHHRRLSAFSGQRIHITWPYGNPCIFLCLVTDTLHICAKQGIHAGDTYHHDRWLFLKSFADFRHCLRDLFQVSSCYNVCLIHQQIIKAVMIDPHGTEHRCITAAASRRHDQHNRIRNCQTCTFDAKSFCSR